MSLGGHGRWVYVATGILALGLLTLSFLAVTRAPTRQAPVRSQPQPDIGSAGGKRTTKTLQTTTTQKPLAGKVVAIDPGHNGGNFPTLHPSIR